MSPGHTAMPELNVQTRQGVIYNGQALVELVPVAYEERGSGVG